MQTVWKTTVEIHDLAIVELPDGAKPLSCREHEESMRHIDIWWLVDTENPMVKMDVIIAGTGHPLQGRIYGRKFVGTTAHGPLRFHVFA